MDTCAGCGAFIMPSWDTCKICGYDPSAPPPVQATEVDTGRKRGRRAKATKAAKAAKPPKAPTAPVPAAAPTDVAPTDVAPAAAAPRVPEPPPLAPTRSPAPPPAAPPAGSPAAEPSRSALAPRTTAPVAADDEDEDGYDEFEPNRVPMILLVLLIVILVGYFGVYLPMREDEDRVQLPGSGTPDAPSLEVPVVDDGDPLGTTVGG